MFWVCLLLLGALPLSDLPAQEKLSCFGGGFLKENNIFNSGNFPGLSAGRRWCGRALFSTVRDAGVIILEFQSRKVFSCPAGTEPKLCKTAAGGCSNQRR